MYTEFYHLKKCPFHITPDPEFLFLSPSHKQALASIIYGVEQRKGFIAIVGEVGVGKTTILRSYLESVDTGRLKIIYTFNPSLSFGGVLKLISRELGIDNPKTDTFEMVDSLHQKLIEEYREGRNVVFIIDEAQNMPVETLEHLRMLSNLETSKDKLMQIVLIGQPELEHLLNQYELRQLKQRIAIYSTISPLTEAESFEYMKFRLSQASSVKTPVFTKGAAQEIIRAAKGIPRSINIISDNALITGFGAQRKPVTSKIVREVIMDMQAAKPKPKFRWAFAVLSAVVLILAAAALIWSDPLLNHALTVVRLPLQQIEKLVMTAPSPSSQTAKPDLAPRTKRTANVDYQGQERLQPVAPPEEPASGSNIQALPTIGLQEEIDKTVSEGKPAPPPTPDIRPDAETSGVFANITKDESTANKPEERVDAGADVPRDTPFTQPVDSQPALQPVSLRSDSAADFPKPAQQAAHPNLQQPNMVRTARRGDTLLRITAEVYDLSVEEVWKKGLIYSVIQLNPHIHNIDIIGIGEKIFFPPLPVPGKTDNKAG